MKTNGIMKMDDETLLTLNKKSDDELDMIFYNSINAESIGFGGAAIKDAILGINNYLEKNYQVKKAICHNKTIANLLLNKDNSKQIESTKEVANILLSFLPGGAAIVAAIKIIRIGLYYYCETESPNKSIQKK